MNTPTRFTKGISTAAKEALKGMYGLPNEVDFASSFWDFNQYVAADWTVTNTTSHYTIGLLAAAAAVPAGGVLQLAGGGTTVSGDVAMIQTNPLTHYFATTDQLWFEFHVQAANASNEEFLAGICSSAATVAPTDGIYIHKAAASASVDLVVRASSASTTSSGITTLVAATDTKIGFYYDGTDVKAYVNDALVARITDMTNLPSATALGTCFGIKASATSPTTAKYYTDYIFAAQTRSY